MIAVVSAIPMVHIITVVNMLHDVTELNFVTCGCVTLMSQIYVFAMGLLCVT